MLYLNHRETHTNRKGEEMKLMTKEIQERFKKIGSQEKELNPPEVARKKRSQVFPNKHPGEI